MLFSVERRDRVLILFFEKCLIYFNKQRFIAVCVNSLDFVLGVVLGLPLVFIKDTAALMDLNY